VATRNWRIRSARTVEAMAGGVAGGGETPCSRSF
jgi:hypothetical protein